MATKKQLDGAITAADVLGGSQDATTTLFDMESPALSTIPPSASDASPQVKYVIFKLVDSKRKGGLHLPATDDLVQNPKTGKRERVYLIHGAPSIWQSELTEFLKDKDYCDRNLRQLYFEGGVLRIPDYDELALEFARVVKHCIDSPHRRSGSRYEYFEYDPQKQARAAYEKEVLQIEMAIAAKGLEEDEVRKIASFLGINFFDDFGIPKDISAVRTELMIKAKNNPVQFQACLNSKEVEIQYAVRKAITRSLIDLQSNQGAATWAGSGKIIGHLPPTENAILSLTRLALTNSEAGREFLTDLKQAVK